MKKIVVTIFAGVILSTGAMAATGVNTKPNCGEVKAAIQDALNNQKAELRSNDKQEENKNQPSSETDAA